MSVAGDQSGVGQRADKLVRAMTQAEKIGLVTGHYPVPMRDEDRPSDALIAAGYIPGIPRLGFPSLKETDASLGVSNVVEMRPGDVATALPCGLAMGATFNADLIEAGGAMIGLEAKSKGFHVLLAGGVNLVRDAWNGRNFEYLGEDPLHSGILGGAAIRGVQSNKMVSTIKHFALNPQESGRKVMSANIEEAGFRESDLLAFQIAIEMGNPHSVMCSYNRVNGTYASANPFLLTDVLRRDWNYRGWVMSDWGAVHATAAAANAGLDQESGQELDSEVFFGDALRRAIEGGEVSAERLDEMTYRIVHGALASGVVDSPPVIAQVDYEAHAAIAQTVAEEGCVLLHNDGTLPLSDATARSILVVGGHASVGVLSGGGSSQVRSVGGVPVEIALMRGEASGFSRRTYHASSPLVALRETMPKCKFTYVDGTDHETVVRLAEQADLTIIFAEQWQTEAHDVPNLSLPDEQDSLIADVASVAQTVVVLETGGAVLMPWIDDVAAVLAAWYPGQRGGEAIARIISGAVNPSGRLPVSFPKSEQDLPRPAPIGLDLQEAAESKRLPGKPSVAYSIPPFDVDYDEGADIGYRWFERNGTATLFPFGHGLSYTDFSYENFAVHDGQAPVVEFTVRNTGKVSGIDTPQVYFVPTRGRPRRLVGWERVTLDAGEAQHVSITVDLRLIADFSVEERVWKVADGEARFVLAKSAEHCASEARLKMASRSLAA